MTKSALIAGASGIVGGTLANHLLLKGWTVIGLARRPLELQGVTSLAVDLLDRSALAAALASSRPTHVFFASWLPQSTETENIRVNATMLKNLLDVVGRLGTVEHVSLVTGLKHYLGPFESYGVGAAPETPFRESLPRTSAANFYYTQEDELFAAAAREGFGWNVHRPHSMIGYAVGNAMNIGTTLAAYAVLCRETGRPFAYPGSTFHWNCLVDMTDARLLARHLEWAATTPGARNEALNVVNGDVFRWRWMWPRIAQWFDLEAAPFDGEGIPLAKQLHEQGATWARIADRYELVESNLARLAPAWHTDSVLGRTIECVTDMSKSRALGFVEYQLTDEAFFDLFAALRRGRVIP
jgi:nucleoside-diphosphate-sugar epimerase